jgi:hypothetical protein
MALGPRDHRPAFQLVMQRSYTSRPCPDQPPTTTIPMPVPAQGFSLLMVQTYTLVVYVSMEPSDRPAPAHNGTYGRVTTETQAAHIAGYGLVQNPKLSVMVCSSQRRVLPSTSVKRNVTVPLGIAVIAHPLSRSHCSPAPRLVTRPSPAISAGQNTLRNPSKLRPTTKTSPPRAEG